MARYIFCAAVAMVAGLLRPDLAEARNRSLESTFSAPIEMGSPTLAPFQHVRFCLRYPADCKTDAAESEQIELQAATLETLKQVNREINLSIIPTAKDYGANLGDGWTIAPDMGDCNDYAVTKRHELVKAGLPAKALRLAVVKTPSGIGHLVLVVVTTKGDLVLDNLSQEIKPWRNSGYSWLKIQSANNSKFWNEIKIPALARAPSADKTIRLADR